MVRSLFFLGGGGGGGGGVGLVVTLYLNALSALLITIVIGTP